VTYLPPILSRKVKQGDAFDTVDVLPEPIECVYEFDDGSKRRVFRYIVRPRSGFDTNRWATEADIDAEYTMVWEGAGEPDDWHSDNIPPTEQEIKRARAAANLHGLPDPTVDTDKRAVVAEQQATIAATLAKIDSLRSTD
jgi:hypothetical protein